MLDPAYPVGPSFRPATGPEGERHFDGSAPCEGRRNGGRQDVGLARVVAPSRGVPAPTARGRSLGSADMRLPGRYDGVARPIVTYGSDPVLHRACAPVTEFDEALRRLLLDMFASMEAADGVGLAANQIGVDARIFVIDCPDAARRTSSATWSTRADPPGRTGRARRAGHRRGLPLGPRPVRGPATGVPRTGGRRRRPGDPVRSRPRAWPRAACSTRWTTSTAPCTSTCCPRRSGSNCWPRRPDLAVTYRRDDAEGASQRAPASEERIEGGVAPMSAA